MLDSSLVSKDSGMGSNMKDFTASPNFNLTLELLPLITFNSYISESCIKYDFVGVDAADDNVTGRFIILYSLDSSAVLDRGSIIT